MRKGDFTLNQMAILFLTLIAIILAIMFLIRQFENAPSRQEFVKDIGKLISGGTYNVCKDYNGTIVREDEFSTILYSAYLGECENFTAEIRTRFNITSSYIKTFALSREIVDETFVPLIVNMDKCIIPSGYDGIFIGSVKEPYFSMYDTITVKQVKKAVVVCKKE